MEEVSINRSSLAPEEEANLLDISRWRNVVNANISYAKKARPVIEGEGIFANPEFNRLFSLSGSFQVPGLNILGNVAREYIIGKNGRYFKGKGKLGENDAYDLHGARYITAIDPNLSVPQKLEIYKEDFLEGINSLHQISGELQNQPYELSPILDYIKNAVVTVFNAYVQSEKVADFHFDDEKYQTQRQMLIDYMRSTVRVYYLSLIDAVTPKELEDLTNEANKDNFLRIVESIRRGYKEYTFSSRFIVRPEAKHPLTNLGSAYLMAEEYPDTDTVVGFPSGSTELACLTADALEYLHGRKVSLLLFPFSLHSALLQFGIKRTAQEVLQELCEYNVSELNDKNVLVIDDNSSTGGTVASGVEAIVNASSPKNVDYGVAEIDVIRSQLTPNRRFIANPKLYDLSTGILAVSRKILRNHDLREIIENNELANYYLEKSNIAENLASQIKYEVFAEGILHPTIPRLRSQPRKEAINRFQNTFLSNFYPTTVVYEGVEYPSVEHAYQRSKFNLDRIRNLHSSIIEGINQTLRLRRRTELITNLPEAFRNSHIPPSDAKRIADALRTYNLVRNEWDDIRIDVMIDLLLQKFQKPELAQMLLNTGDKDLIEGNDWNDTFWGISNDRERNILGLILMNIREKLRSGKLKTT